MIKVNFEEIQSQTIAYLRFPLTILVFYIHMNPQENSNYVEMNNILWSNGLNLQEVYSILGTSISIFSNIAVPSFFVFAGFLFFYRIENWNLSYYLKNVSKRIKTLCIPYIIWNIMPVFLSIFFIIIKHESLFDYLTSLWNNGILHIFWNSTTWDVNFVNIFGWSQQLWGPQNLPLWFLRDLIIICFLSPILLLGIKYLKKYFLFLLGICYLLNLWPNIPGFSITSFFFFSLGSSFGFYKKNMVIEFSKFRYIFGAIAIVTLILSIIYKGMDFTKITMQLYIMTGVFSVFIITAFLIQNEKIKVNAFLSKSSFFLYCFHSIAVLTISHRILIKIFGTENLLCVISSYLLSPFLCAIICLSIFFLLKKITPGLLNILTGNRN